MLHHLVILLLCSTSAFSAPQAFPSVGLQSDPDPDPTANSVFYPNPVVSTIPLSGSPTDPPTPPVDSTYIPIDANKYFYVNSKCSPEHQLFYKEAYEGAVAIAQAGARWPLYGTDASDLYFGKGTENSEPASSEIPANLIRAASWNTAEFGFDDYLILRCPADDPGSSNHCDGRVGDDPRPITCYVNSTTNWWWWQDTISCCPIFFTMMTLKEQYDRNKGKSALDLRELQNSGHTLLHEMMHAFRVTMDRRHLVDEIFDGNSGRRIYGAKDVAKAARIYGIERTGTNADSYAQFANAMYWKARLGILPQPSLAPADPPGYIDLVSDHQDNYIQLVRPLAPGAPPLTPSPEPAPTALDLLATPLPSSEDPPLVTAPPSTAAAPPTGGSCPTTSPASPIPGCWGTPGCAYVVAGDLGPDAACPSDYCNCGGFAVPLLPTTVGGSATVGCGGYTTQPTVDACPPPSAAAPTATGQ